MFRSRDQGPLSVFLIVNECGNHGMSADPLIVWTRSALASYWSAPGDDTRGILANSFPLTTILARGYAIATSRSSDIEEDRATPDIAWGVIGAGAYGMSRAVDDLVDAPRIDGARIAVVGSSRWAKTALRAGAQDERIELVLRSRAALPGSRSRAAWQASPSRF